jgi:hypothetical protein
MANEWSVEKFCAIELLKSALDIKQTHHATAQEFLENLGLSRLHPMCAGGTQSNDWQLDTSAPQMGPVEIDLIQLHNGSYWSTMVTRMFMAAPRFLAFWSLWFLLFAAIIAPVGCFYLIMCYNSISDHEIKSQTNTPTKLSIVCTLTVASTLAMMKDTMYAHDFGMSYSVTLFSFSSLLAFRTCTRFRLSKTIGCLVILWIMAVTLPSNYIEETVDGLVGLHYNNQNPLVHRIASLWDAKSRVYSRENGATRWMTTGDVRTGLPFFLNKIDDTPNWTRVWLPTESSVDKIALALDISFPKTGHDDSKPVYLVFHGLSGGSAEGYILDLTKRRNQEGSTVIVLIARGLMGTPVFVCNVFLVPCVVDH